MRARKHVEKICSGPKGNSDFFWADFSNFGPVLAIQEVFLTELKKNKKMKKFHMTFEDVTKLFLFFYLYF